MRWRGGGQGASRIRADDGDGISTTGRARRQATRGGQFDIRRNVRRGNRRASDLAKFHSPVIHRRVNLNLPTEEGYWSTKSAYNTVC